MVAGSSNFVENQIQFWIWTIKADNWLLPPQCHFFVKIETCYTITLGVFAKLARIKRHENVKVECILVFILISVSVENSTAARIKI